MALKKIQYDVQLLSTETVIQAKVPAVYTNDLNSVEFVFNILDMTTEQLAGATATTLLYMRDGSFFQNSDVHLNGNTFTYLLKENEGNHAGLAQIQLVVKIGTIGYATQLFNFQVAVGLETKVSKAAVEVMIHDWTALTREAQAYIAQFLLDEEGRQATFEANEQDRQLAFDGAEELRQQKETERQQAETQRTTAEFVRVANEAERISKDSERDSKIEAVERLQADIISGAVDSAAVQQHVEERYGQLEEEYTPKLTEVTAQLAQTEGGLASVQNANAKDFLRIKNYLGNFENIHPKVVNFETAWNGFKYWMAYTPYPQGATEHENPCIAVSNNLINWTTPDGLVNPLDSGDSVNYNSDTHLLYRPDKNWIEIWWRQRRASDNTWLIYRRTSMDGISWSTKELMIHDNMMSLSVIFEDNKYKMWWVGNGIMYRESVDSTGKTWTQPTTLNIDWGELRPWHMDIIRTDISLEMVVQAYGNGGTNNSSDLYYVQGDGNSFTKPKLILARNVDPQAFDSVGIYRSSLIKVKGIYHLFYSAIGPGAMRAIALSSGRNIFGLNGVTDQNERMLTVLDDSKTELREQEIRDYDKFRFIGDGVTELSIIRGGYVGQRISLVIGKNSRNLKVVLKHNVPYLEMPNGKNFILETSGDYRVTMAVDLICQATNNWRIVGHVPLDPATSGKTFHAVSAGGTVYELDVSNIDVITLGGAGIEVKSLKGGYKGKVVHFLATSGATNATIVNSTRLITLGNTNYLFTPAKMGMTAICMSPEPYNIWRVF